MSEIQVKDLTKVSSDMFEIQDSLSQIHLPSILVLCHMRDRLKCRYHEEACILPFFIQRNSYSLQNQESHTLHSVISLGVDLHVFKW